MSLNNLRFRTRMILLVGVCVAGLIGTHIMYMLMLATVRVNGPLYRVISGDQGLYAELLPPPLLTGQSFLLLYQMTAEKDAEVRERMIERFNEFKPNYEKRRAHWMEEINNEDIRAALSGRAHELALEFYRIAENKVIKEMQKPDVKPETLLPVVNGPVRVKYEEHRAAVFDLARTVKELVKKRESEARDTIEWWGTIQLVVGIGILIVILALGAVIVHGILRPTSALIERMCDMSEGAADLTKRVEVESRDEIGQLATLINGVIQRIHDLIARVRVSTIQLNSTATEIAASSTEQNTLVQGFNASSSQIAAGVAEITATGQELLKTVEEVRERSSEAAGLAGEGRSGLGGMVDTMKQLSEATSSISSKLGMIREKAGGINVVVTTITKVADQTNLLSINAAIEAEKAGEAGRGFLVVAREIRRLADQTAVATLDIEQMVRHMQAAVSAGVMEMDKFSEQVRGCIAQVSQIGGQIGQIIEQVQALSSRFEEVSEGMRQQAQGARQIDEAMGGLTGGVRQVSNSVRDFQSAAENLRESARELQREVGQFTVAG